MNHDYLRGKIVKIYQKPLTLEDFGGYAHILNTEDSSDYPLIRCTVRFMGDDLKVSREILIPVFIVTEESLKPNRI